MTNNNSGRVTIRDVYQLIGQMETKLDVHLDELRKQNVQQGELIATCVARLNAKRQRLDSIEQDIKTLRTQNRIWEGINSLGVIIGTILGINK